MKILFIHNNYASNSSGEEFSAETLEQLLISKGHEVAWYRRFSDVIESSLRKKVSAFFTGVYNPKAIREINELLDTFKPDVVQIQNLYPFISPSILKTIRRNGIPIIMRCPNYRLFCPTGLHMDGKGRVCEKCLGPGREINCITKNCEKDYGKSIGYAWRNFMARTFWGITRNMDAYIVQTAFQKEKFIRNGIPQNKLYIVPGITPILSSNRPAVKSDYVSFVGRVSEEKGIVEFINAARLLPELTFVVAGHVSKSLTRVKLNAPSNVIWKGFQSGEELDLIFSQSRIIAVPSKWYEGFPNVITRAMTLGIPVITSNLGAMSAIIEHQETGLLIEPGDSAGLANAIQELYSNEEKCRKLGARAKERASFRYSSEKVYSSLIDLYKRLLKEKKRSKTISGVP